MASESSTAARVIKACAAPVDDLFYESLLVLVGIVAVVVIGISTGTIDQFYSNVIDLTSDGVPWTSIMRQNPWIWPAGSILLIYLVALVARLARRSPRTVRLWIAAVSLGLGFVGGHVYWASSPV